MSVIVNLSADVASYNLDETTGALVLTYRVQAKVLENPENVQSLGSVIHLEWSPFCCTVAVSWSNGSLAGFSVFGSQLWFTHHGQLNKCDSDLAAIRTFDWGPEGFQLWYGCSDDVMVGKFGRPISLTNLTAVINYSAVGCDGRNFLQLYHRLQAQHQRLALICSEEVLLSRPRAAEAQMYAAAQSYWQKIQIPWNYMGYAWPLRVSSNNCNAYRRFFIY